MTNFCLHTTAAYIVNRRSLNKLVYSVVPFTDEIDVHLASASLCGKLKSILPAGWPALALTQVDLRSQRLEIDHARADATLQ